MLFEKKLMPDFTLNSFRELTPDIIKSLGASALISDIDNTLAPYEALDPPDEVRNWLRIMTEAGIKVSLVSNNHEKRVTRFAKDLPCRAYPMVGKPRTKHIKAAMREMGSTKDTTVFLGDQLLTDALAAHRAGMKCFIVPPIKDKKSLFFKFKRSIERPYMRKFNSLKDNKENG